MEFILNTILWTLALYGLFEIIKTIIYISTYTKMQPDGIHIIIAVKNQEEKIEGFWSCSWNLFGCIFLLFITNCFSY